VRSKPKDHGLTNLIEGEDVEGRRTVVVEDLISTGRSSLNAVTALRDAGMPVEGMTAIFTYDFPVAAERFREAACELYTLTDYHHLLDVAVKTGYIEQQELETLQEWRKDPAGWRPEA